MMVNTTGFISLTPLTIVYGHVGKHSEAFRGLEGIFYGVLVDRTFGKQA